MIRLDEPSLGLAPQIVQRIFQILTTIVAEGTTILLVEQNAHMALAVATTAHVLEVGALVSSGPAAELARDGKIPRLPRRALKIENQFRFRTGRRTTQIARAGSINISPGVLALGPGVIPFSPP